MVVQIKKFIVSSILATDMSKHNRYIEKIRSRVETANEEFSNSEDK